MPTFRAAIRILLIVALLAALLPLHYVTRALAGRSPWPRRFLAGTARIAGARVRTAGEPVPAPVLLAANHLSWLDILVLAAASGCAFVAKAEIARWPTIGRLAGLNRTIYVERARRAAVGGQADTLRRALAGAQPVALFPEGTTGAGTELLPFRPSLFAAVAPPPPGVRVQPVLIDYGPATAALAWGAEEGAAANALRLLGRRGGFIATVRFLDPVDPAACGDRKAVAAAVEAAIGRAWRDGAAGRLPLSAPR